MRAKCKLGAVLVVGLVSLAWVGHAAPIIDNGGTAWELVDASTPPGGGTGSGTLTLSQQPDAYDSNPGGASIFNNAVEFSGPDTTAAGVYDDLVRVTSGNLIAGFGPTYTSVATWFYSNGSYAPAQLSIYLETGDGVSWWYDVATAAQSAWSYYSVSLTDLLWYDAYALGGTSLGASLVSDGLVNAGIRVMYEPDLAAQDYGLRDYQFLDDVPIPEPGTYMLLSTAVMSLGYTFARRRRVEKKA
jgi:hypothetical protein